MRAARRVAPGLVVALAAVGVAALVHAGLPGVPLLTVCVVLGVLAAQIPSSRSRIDGALQPGVASAARRCMRLGVVLLGLQLVLGDLLRLGWVVVAAVVGVTAVAFAGTYAIGRLARLPGDEPLLLAAGFSICGASAVGAMAAVTRSPREEQARPVALVTLCGTLAIVVLPVLASALGMTVQQFGRWTGASVHDVGQVVATAQEWGSRALAVAIVVKLLRVLLLAPLVAGTGLVLRLRGRAEGAVRAPIVPLFVVGFVAAFVLRTVLPLPPVLLAVATVLQTVLLGMALFALGSGIRIPQLARTGGRTALAALASWVLIAALAWVAVAR